MRWLIAVVALAVASPTEAGVFKQRGGSKPAAAAPAKKPAAAPAPAKKPAAAPAKKTQVSKSPAKKSGKTRPDDLTPDESAPVAAAPTKKKGKGGDVTITVEDEDDVIIRDIDD